MKICRTREDFINSVNMTGLDGASLAETIEKSRLRGLSDVEFWNLIPEDIILTFANWDSTPQGQEWWNLIYLYIRGECPSNPPTPVENWGIVIRPCKDSKNQGDIDCSGTLVRIISETENLYYVSPRDITAFNIPGNSYLIRAIAKSAIVVLDGYNDPFWENKKLF